MGYVRMCQSHRNADAGDVTNSVERISDEYGSGEEEGELK